jgi:hypothetical protein
MAMTREEKLAYARGYQGGAKWPLHKPPTPPDAVIAKLVSALRAIRDECDGLLATLEPDDDFAKLLDPQIDRADAALSELGKWIVAPPSSPSDDTEVKRRNRKAAMAYYYRNREKVLEAKRRYDAKKRAEIRSEP